MASKHVGTGGGLRYLNEIAYPHMNCHELPDSCQVACVRQILRDAGVEVSEHELRMRSGYVDGFGTACEFASIVLDELRPTLGYNGGVVSDATTSVEVLLRRDPWIASLSTDYHSIHAVIVDGRQGDIVYIRDPWGLDGFGKEIGSQATILFSDFLNHWDLAFNICISPVRRK